MKAFFERLYHSLISHPVMGYFRFWLHRYGPQDFNPLHMKNNLKLWMSLEPDDWLESSQSGALHALKTSAEKRRFVWKNWLTFGAARYRLHEVVLYTFLTSTIELNNPFHRNILEPFVERKIALIEKLVAKMPLLNGSSWNTSAIDYHLQRFRRYSLLQLHIIEKMEQAVAEHPHFPLEEEIKAAVKKGIHPQLVVMGRSGSYWMRDRTGAILGLFKPFDEESFAPNNPVGPIGQGALGQRRMRHGIRVGESAHREVAAFFVDQFFGFGIVPRTYYATFTHPIFFHAREKPQGRRSSKTKMGSFQEYVEGFSPLHTLSKEDISKIPLDEFQLLVLLDMIVGNMDRHSNNILVADGKIAAIDHGLTFSDRPDAPSTWYWRHFEQAKQPLIPSLKALVEHFPFEELMGKLNKECQIELPSLHRMRERMTLFQQAILKGMTLAELGPFLTVENLKALVELDATLPEKARAILAQEP